MLSKRSAQSAPPRSACALLARLRWIENFRKTMRPYTDGAFINFVDRDIPLEEYYKDNLPQLLVEVKRQWDPGDFFKFEMSIPPR